MSLNFGVYVYQNIANEIHIATKYCIRVIFDLQKWRNIKSFKYAGS